MGRGGEVCILETAGSLREEHEFEVDVKYIEGTCTGEYFCLDHRCFDDQHMMSEPDPLRNNWDGRRLHFFRGDCASPSHQIVNTRLISCEIRVESPAPRCYTAHHRSDFRSLISEGLSHQNGVRFNIFLGHEFIGWRSENLCHGAPEKSAAHMAKQTAGCFFLFPTR